MAGGGMRFRITDFLVRWLFCFGLLVATYNPTGHCYVDWALDPAMDYIPVKAFVGVLLLTIYVFVVSMVLRTLGLTGMFASVVFFSALTWAGYSLGVRLPTVALSIMWVQFAIATTLAGGLSLSLVRIQASGQITPSEAH